MSDEPEPDEIAHSWRPLAPPGGWASFKDSAAVTELLWRRLRGWTYMNLVRGSSIWEGPTAGPATTTIQVWYEADEQICEVVVEFGEAPDPDPDAEIAHDIMRELYARYGIADCPSAGKAP